MGSGKSKTGFRNIANFFTGIRDPTPPCAPLWTELWHHRSSNMASKFDDIVSVLKMSELLWNSADFLALLKQSPVSYITMFSFRRLWFREMPLDAYIRRRLKTYLVRKEKSCKISSSYNMQKYNLWTYCKLVQRSPINTGPRDVITLIYLLCWTNRILRLNFSGKGYLWIASTLSQHFYAHI